MKTQDLIKILKNNQFSEKTAELLRQEVAKYPYFTPLVVAYLLSLKVTENINFKNELGKLSIYISNHRTLIKKLIEVDYLKATNKLKPDKEIDEEQLQKELYERSKQHHDQIVQEIIEPKIEKLRKLSELAKQKEEIFTPAGTTGTVAEQTKEAGTVPEQPEKLTATEEKTPEKQTDGTKAEKFETSTIPTPEKTQPEQQPGQTKTEKPQASSIDDIFKKIEELKKQKLRAVSDFEKRVSTVDRLIGEQKVREEVSTAEQRLAERRKRREERLKAKEEAKQAARAEAQKTETHPETKPVTEKQTTEQTPIEETQLIDFEIPTKTEKKAEEKQPGPKAKDEILIPSPQPQPEPEEKDTEAKPDVKDKQPEKQAEPEKPKTTSPAPETGTTPQPAKTTTPPTTSSDKKSAADRILEEIARRREMRKKKQIELIERFLEEQPSIDRNKKPSIEGDLSEPHTKEIEVVTEKMAQIYEMQGLYDKAINIYQKLILQKPEKKDYFAQKIEKLKQQINN